MSITLQDFASGDTNYVAKLNSNSDVIEAAIAALQSLTGGAAFSALSLSAAYAALFGTGVAVIGDDSYASSDAGSGDLLVAAGYCYRPSLGSVLSKLTTTTLDFTGQSAATYYVVIDSTGAPTRDTLSTEAIYSVVWTGSAFGAITRLAAVVWGAADWIASQTSTALSATYTSLDDRLEAIEAAASVGAVAQHSNYVYAGPAGGSPTNGIPTFRALVSADVAGLGLGAGTVTSVNLTQPAAGVTVSGGPVTSSGSITLALADDLAAVETLATTGIVRRTGVSTWSAGTAVDLTSEVTGVLPVANYATGTPSGAKFVRDDGVLAVPPGTGGAGSVTSVALSLPSDLLTVSGSPVTTSGTLTAAKANVDSYTVYAGPTAGSPTVGVPTFRALTYADLPTGSPGRPRVDAHAYSAGSPTFNCIFDCASYDVFEITLTGDISIGFSGATDGQRILVRVTQDGTGSRLITWDSGVAFGSDITSATASTSASKVDYFGLAYNSTAGKYHMIAVARGY